MAPPAWHIHADEITQTTELNKSGTGLTDMYVIPFTIDSGPAAGHTGQVKVPVNSAGPEQVAALINASADVVHQIGGLKQDASGGVTY